MLYLNTSGFVPRSLPYQGVCVCVCVCVCADQTMHNTQFHVDWTLEVPAHPIILAIIHSGLQPDRYSVLEADRDRLMYPLVATSE